VADDDLRALAADLVFEVRGLEMPAPANPVPSAGAGHDWRIDGALDHDGGEPLELALACVWDLRRRAGEAARRGARPAAGLRRRPTLTPPRP
jgi:hypothetical protein